MARTSLVEKTLAELQRLVRRPASGPGGGVKTIRIPSELVSDETDHLSLLADEVQIAEKLEAALVADLEFEHLRKPEEEIHRFIAECWTDRETDYVPVFIARYRREPSDHTCFMPVEHLVVEAPITVLGIRLVPVDDPSVPRDTAGRFALDKPVGCVACVTVRGTDHTRMAERARQIAEHALRVLRVALREDRGIHDWQLRFRLGMAYAFGDNASGWDSREDTAYELDLNGLDLDLIDRQPVSAMPVAPSSDIEKKADLALRWMERAWLTGEPLVALLFLFFALEALLGDKSKKLKAHDLVFRKTMLGHVVDGRFAHPNNAWLLYDKVRSGAVHGEDAPPVSWDIVTSLSWEVRTALNEYLKVASDQDFKKRGKLLTFLDKHPDRSQLIAWLRSNGGTIWTPYLDGLEGDGGDASTELHQEG